VSLGAVPVRTDAAPLINLGFDGLALGPFAGYTQSGFDVDPLSGTWLTRTSYGDPAPFVYFEGHAYLQPAVTASLEITDGGDAFTFKSVDLYSSVTKIPWVFTGFRNGIEVFSANGELPNTLGTFVTTSNPFALIEIDRLVVALTQPTNVSCDCALNPMGPDNIVVQRVPEPGTTLLFSSAVAIAGAWRRRR
jgi:hypothetical protein